jgi:hypothetical protein
VQISLCMKMFPCFVLQHANEDVERMILGNKCDIEDKRQVSRERGTVVSIVFLCNPRVLTLIKHHWWGC